jgi:hypothetical protein
VTRPAPEILRIERRVALLVAPLCLAAAFGGGWLALRHPGWLFAAVATVVLGGALLWILVSALSPATADRGCPECGADTLVRLDAGTTRGVRCTACGHRDASVSSFYLAEEEGPLEHIVLAERAGRQGRRQGRRREP